MRYKDIRKLIKIKSINEEVFATYLFLEDCLCFLNLFLKLIHFILLAFYIFYIYLLKK